VEKYGTARKATADTTIRCMCFACWINKATDTHSEYTIFMFFHRNRGFANAPKYDVYTYLACLVPTLSSAIMFI
jgi:hypothetical protein